MAIDLDKAFVPAGRRRAGAATPRRLRFAIAGILVAIGPGAAFGKVYKCVDAKTKAVTLSQFACPDARSPSVAEAASSVEAARVAAIEDEARQSAARADRQLLERFPDEASHRRAEAVEIEGVIRNIAIAMRRFDELVARRKGLDAEAAFHPSGPMPASLRRSIDDNDGSFNGLADTFRGQERSVIDIVARYRVERERLHKLLAGASAGSMGPLDAGPGPAGANTALR